jgi:hypothetical protein
MFNTNVGAVGAGAASRYGSGSCSGSDQKMRLLAAPAPQHWLALAEKMFLSFLFLLDNKCFLSMAELTKIFGSQLKIRFLRWQ